MISVSVFSVAFASGRVLKPSARGRIISPLLFWWGKRKETCFFGGGKSGFEEKSC